MNAPLRYTLDVTTTRGMIHVGDCLAWLRSLPDESVDAVVTDPPYGLGREPDPREVLAAWLAGDEYKPGGAGFMGRAWDAFVPSPCVWQECLRVLKPGGHLLAFAGTRTYDWIVLGARLAGFEVRDMLSWVYSTGFPKSLDVSKAIDAAGGINPADAARALRSAREHAGMTRLEVASRVGCTESSIRDWEEGRARVAGGPVEHMVPSAEYRVRLAGLFGYTVDARLRAGTRQRRANDGTVLGLGHGGDILLGGNTDAARQWHGWGTALKPAVEPIVMARKPLRGTVASNVLEHGTGGLNVDGCRVGASGGTAKANTALTRGSVTAYGNGLNGGGCVDIDAGRWPANLLHDGSDEVVGLFPQTGPASGRVRNNAAYRGASKGADKAHMTVGHEDNGGSAARFFYCAKATRREREAGLDHLPRGIVDPTRAEDSAGRDNPRAGAGRKGGGRANVHPTVKPLALMRWLVRLVTPPGGLVIDPYAGSGTTGVAAVCEGMRFAGAELDTWHAVLAHERIAYAMGHGPSGFEDVAEGDEDDDNGADVVPMQAALPLGG